MFFNEEYKLLNATEEDIVAENTVLFSVEYFMLGNNSIKIRIVKFLEMCRKNKGLFNPFPNSLGTKDQYMSHDNLTAVVAFSKLNGYHYHKEIWDYLVKHLFTYDNVSGKINFKRTVTVRS